MQQCWSPAQSDTNLLQVCTNTSAYTVHRALPVHMSLRSSGHYHVRSAGHYILQLEHMHKPEQPAQPQLVETQEVPTQMLQLGPPPFKLAGLAIGNGLTDPKLQVMLVLPLTNKTNLINITTETPKKSIINEQKCGIFVRCFHCYC